MYTRAYDFVCKSCIHKYVRTGGYGYLVYSSDKKFDGGLLAGVFTVHARHHVAQTDGGVGDEAEINGIDEGPALPGGEHCCPERGEHCGEQQTNSIKTETCTLYLF